MEVCYRNKELLRLLHLKDWIIIYHSLSGDMYPLLKSKVETIIKTLQEESM